jgi:cell division protease FtsH
MSIPQSPKPQDPKNTPPTRQQRLLRVLLVSFVTYLTVSVLLPGPGTTVPADPVPLSRVLSLIETGNGGAKVTEVVMNENRNEITVVLSDKTAKRATYPFAYADELTTKVVDAKIKLTTTAPSGPNFFANLFLTLLPVLLILGFLLFLSRKGGLGGIGAKFGSKKTTPVEVPTTRFSDIAGVAEAVEDLREVIDVLHHPERFERIGAKPSRGFLLVGPPGTGKTLLARAVAGEAGVPFFAISGSDFVEMFVGLGAARVRELFEKARACGKAIVFIDEIDAVGKARGGIGAMSGANDERENTLNQLLVELDGFTQSGLVLIAATNRPDVLDPALTRPGRFDRKVLVPAPDRAGRQQILELYAKGKPVAGDVDWHELAKRTPGMTGADLSGLMNEAALEAARRDLSEIDTQCIEAALQTSMLGRERRSAQVTERDREIVAWHEAGHAVCALALEHAADPVTVTIVPRGVAGGVTWMSGSDHAFLTRTQARAQLAVAMGGRAAEELLLNGDFTQGAHGDLSSATQLATEMVSRYGMGSKMIVRGERMPIGGDPVEDEVAEMIAGALHQARDVLRAHRRLVEGLAALLLEEETVSKQRMLTLAEELDAGLIELRAAHDGTDRGASSTPEPNPFI